MPSSRLALGAVGLTTVVVSEKRNAKRRVTALTIDNQGGAGNRRVIVVDRFTPSITNGVPIPVVTPVNRFDAGLLANGVGVANIRTFDANDLKNVEILGQLELLIDVADANCFASIAWEDE